MAQSVLGPDVVLVDSAQNAAAALARKLKETRLGRPAGAQAGLVTICTTDLPVHIPRLVERFLGGSVDAIRQVAVEARDEQNS